MNIFPARFLLFFRRLAFGLLGCLVAAPLWAHPSHFTLLFTNDQLGQLEPASTPNPADGAVGGAARRMALIEKIRKEVGPSRVFLVDAGNLFGKAAVSDPSRGAEECEAYRLMDYDAVTLGDRDFDEGEKTLLGFAKDYRIHWISANAITSGGQNFMQSYVLRHVPGLRIGIIGFSNEKTPELTKRENVRGLTFYSPIAVAEGLHSILRKDVDFYIALTHEGLIADEQLAKKTDFLNVIVGGHSLEAMATPVVDKRQDGTLNGPLIVQAGSHGLYLGRLDLEVDGDHKHGYAIHGYQYHLIPITQDMPQDPRMRALLDQFEKKQGSAP